MERGFFSLALVATTALFAQPALAADQGPMVEAAAVAALAPNQFVWNDPGTSQSSGQPSGQSSGEPVRVVVNIAEQRAYVYRGQALVAATTVSTGRDGKDTPSGSFTVLEKQVDHHSNRYNNAAMPFMQRLTWDGVAIHAGQNPGFPASHGCVRVPLAFARKLYGITSVGTQVTVIGADGLVDPTPAAAAPDVEASETAAANRAMLRVASR